MSLIARKDFALIILVVAAVIGASSFMAFLFFLYAGSLNRVQLGMNEVERLVFNTLISVAFFLQHSLMIRRPFRQCLSVLIPSHYQGAVYTVVFSLPIPLANRIMRPNHTLADGRGKTAPLERNVLRVINRGGVNIK